MLRETRSAGWVNPLNPTQRTARTKTGATKGTHQVHSTVPEFLVDYPNIEVHSENFPALEGNQITGLRGMERSKQGEVHVVGLEKHATG